MAEIDISDLPAPSSAINNIDISDLPAPVQQQQLYQRQPVQYSADPEAAAFGEWAFQNPQAAKELAKKGLETTALVGAGLATRNPLYAGLAYGGAKQLEYGLEGDRVQGELARAGRDVGFGVLADIAPKAVLGAGKLAVNKAAELAAPTVKELKGLRDAAYSRFTNSGLNFDFSNVLPSLKQKMLDMKFNPINHPKLAPAMKRIEELIDQGTDLTAQEVKELREVFNKAFTGRQGEISTALKKDLDTAVTQVSPQAAQDLSQGIDAHRRLVNSQRIDRLVSQAEKSSKDTSIGIKDRIAKLLEKPSGFTQAEQNELIRIAQGTPTQSIMQSMGRISPSSAGTLAALPQASNILASSQTMGLGAASLFNPTVPLLAAGTALGSKKLVNTLVKSEANALAARIRAGGGAQLPESVVRKVETYAPAGINLLYNPFANQGQQ